MESRNRFLNIFLQLSALHLESNISHPSENKNAPNLSQRLGEMADFAQCFPFAVPNSAAFETSPVRGSRQAELSMSNQSINPKSYKWSSCRLMVSEYHLEIMSWLFFFFSLNVIFRCYKWELDGIRVGTGPFWKSESFSQADGVVGWDTHWDPWIGSGP